MAVFSMLYYECCKKTRMRLLSAVPAKARFRKAETCGSKKPQIWRKKHERYFNETTFGSRCSLWTSDKKMEPLRWLSTSTQRRNGIYIIDLQKSVGKVDEAYQAVSDIAAEGGTILFVGTKKQAQDAIKTEAERCGMFYVNERWLGGMLTNFKTIQSRIERLKEIEAMAEDGTFDVLPKKEVIALKKEWEKLEKNLGGIKNMKRLPDAIFVVDPKKERICVQEAHTLGIPLIGIADTNCDPEELDYVIPGNDDAIRAVKLIVSKMADAVVEANQGATGEEGIRRRRYRSS